MAALRKPELEPDQPVIAPIPTSDDAVGTVVTASLRPGVIPGTPINQVALLQARLASHFEADPLPLAERIVQTVSRVSGPVLFAAALGGLVYLLGTI